MGKIDPETGELTGELEPLEREQFRAEQAEIDLQLANEDLARQRRIIASLKAQLGKQKAEAPEGKSAELIARYYSKRMTKTKGWKFGEKRKDCVIARLREGFTPEYMCRAIDGLAIGASQNQDTGVKYDDLEFQARNEVHLERFHEVAERNDAPTLITPAWLRCLAGLDFLPSELSL